MKKGMENQLRMELKITKTTLHPLCANCYNYQTPKDHGRMLQSSKYYHIWEDSTITSKKIKSRKRNVQIQRIVMKKNKDGRKYDHPFSSLVPTCLGLDVNILKKNNYPFMDRPPCFIDEDLVRER